MNNEEIAKEIYKATVAGAAGGGTALGAVAASGITGLSGPGIMTGLAALGLGSAAAGILVTGGIAIGIGWGTHRFLKKLIG